MTTPPIVEGLLDFADDVLRAPAPKPAALRRAVSAAYYAVFHQLVRSAARQIFGDDPVHEVDWQVASRWYSHHDVKVVSGWVVNQAGRRQLPQSLQLLLDTPSPELIELAGIVSELQDSRIEADYVASEDLEADEVGFLVCQARRALALLTRLSGDRVSDNYLMLLLGGPRLPLRRAG
ncbi:MAG: hypothetical protein V7637_1359 [Mycobacteriales bacterium]|jgi:hypothetical protein